MSIDSTFEFEQRRNRPVKYDRNLMSQTVQTMQKLSDIQSQRSERFFQNRMADAKIIQKKTARKEIEQSIELLAPAVAHRETVMRNVVDAARARIAARTLVSKKQLANEASQKKTDVAAMEIGQEG